MCIYIHIYMYIYIYTYIYVYIHINGSDVFIDNKLNNFVYDHDFIIIFYKQINNNVQINILYQVLVTCRGKV